MKIVCWFFHCFRRKIKMTKYLFSGSTGHPWKVARFPYESPSFQRRNEWMQFLVECRKRGGNQRNVLLIFENFWLQWHTRAEDLHFHSPFTTLLLSSNGEKQCLLQSLLQSLGLLQSLLSSESVLLFLEKFRRFERRIKNPWPHHAIKHSSTKSSEESKSKRQ